MGAMGSHWGHIGGIGRHWGHIEGQWGHIGVTLGTLRDIGVTLRDNGVTLGSVGQWGHFGAFGAIVTPWTEYNQRGSEATPPSFAYGHCLSAPPLSHNLIKRVKKINKKNRKTDNERKQIKNGT